MIMIIKPRRVCQPRCLLELATAVDSEIPIVVRDMLLYCSAATCPDCCLLLLCRLENHVSDCNLQTTDPCAWLDAQAVNVANKDYDYEAMRLFLNDLEAQLAEVQTIIPTASG